MKATRLNRLGTLARARREPTSGGGFWAYLWSSLAGLLIPVLVVLVGLLAVLLDSGNLRLGVIRLGTHLYVPMSQRFTELEPLFQLMQLVVIAFLVAIVFALAVWLHRRAANHRTREITKSLHRLILRQSLRRAEVEGAAAQAVQADQLIGEHLPELGNGLSLWYRAIPRSVLTFLGCLAVALLVNVWLATLAIVSGVIIWQLFLRLRRTDHSDLFAWELPRSRKRMAELVGQAPLLARLQSDGLAEHAFDAELETLYRHTTEEDNRVARIWPVLFAALATAVAIMVLGLGVNMDRGLSLPSALTIGLALSGAAIAAGRLATLGSQLAKSSLASSAIYQYLERDHAMAPSEQRVGLVGVRDCVELHDVTLGDSPDRPILSHLSLKLTPGSMVALLGTDAVSTRALTELLMGFGMPREGRITIDGVQLRDVHPQALARNVMWIDPGGPVYDGTIEENLRGADDSINNGDMVKALQEVDVYEQLFRLPEGLSTIVGPADSMPNGMLNTEASYAIGVARALLHQPSIVLASEPPPPAEHLSDDPCLLALQRLRDQGSLIVMLPRRLQTLRLADRVVLLNGPRITGEGKHAELLTDSDLYRHLNYLLFNPYRHGR